MKANLTRKARLADHKAKMAAKKARRATIVSDYPKPEMRSRIVTIAGVKVPQLYATGRTLGPGGFVASKNDSRDYRKQA